MTIKQIEKTIRNIPFLQPVFQHRKYPRRQTADRLSTASLSSCGVLPPNLPQILPDRKHAQKRLHQLARQQSVQIPLNSQHGNQPEYKEQAETQAHHTEQKGRGSTSQPVQDTV